LLATCNRGLSWFVRVFVVLARGNGSRSYYCPLAILEKTAQLELFGDDRFNELCAENMLTSISENRMKLFNSLQEPWWDKIASMCPYIDILVGSS
jgi:hypothetical protein